MFIILLEEIKEILIGFNFIIHFNFQLGPDIIFGRFIKINIAGYCVN
jgi:hypothetical protein